MHNLHSAGDNTFIGVDVPTKRKFFRQVETSVTYKRKDGASRLFVILGSAKLPLMYPLFKAKPLRR